MKKGGKKPKGGKGKKKGGSTAKGKDVGDEEKLSMDMKLKKSQMRIEALERYLVLRSDQAQRARAEQEEMKERLTHLDEDFEKEKLERFHIASDMTRQYKAMQEELIGRINVLSNTITDLRDQLELARIALEEVKKEKDQVIAAKDKEIAEQKQKMEDMAIEFGEMLKETLEKMRHRINSSNTVDDDPSTLIDKSRFKDFGLENFDLAKYSSSASSSSTSHHND